MNATIVLLISLITTGGAVREHAYEMPSMGVCIQSVNASKTSGDAQQLFCVEVKR